MALGAAATSASLAAAACSTGTVPGPGADASADGATFDAGPRDTGLPDTSNIAMPYGAPPADGLYEMV